MATHKKPTTQDLESVVADSMAPDKQHTDTTQKITKHSTKTTHTTHKNSTINTLKRYDVRFNPDDWEWLKQHFQAKGLTVSAGLRMIIKDYMQKEKV